MAARFTEVNVASAVAARFIKPNIVTKDRALGWLLCIRDSAPHVHGIKPAAAGWRAAQEFSRYFVAGATSSPTLPEQSGVRKSIYFVVTTEKNSKIRTRFVSQDRHKDCTTYHQHDSSVLDFNYIVLVFTFTFAKQVEYQLSWKCSVTLNLRG